MYKHDSDIQMHQSINKKLSVELKYIKKTGKEKNKISENNSTEEEKSSLQSLKQIKNKYILNNNNSSSKKSKK